MNKLVASAEEAIQDVFADLAHVGCVTTRLDGEPRGDAVAQEPFFTYTDASTIDYTYDAGDRLTQSSTRSTCMRMPTRSEPSMTDQRLEPRRWPR